jgi:hypothetical protein
VNIGERFLHPDMLKDVALTIETSTSIHLMSSRNSTNHWRLACHVHDALTQLQ